ncbi:N-acetylglucosamine-6-phosphate deacetylase [Clostridia bacterium]|nr:N-acetylglucosamine-6-phosphate deacetylase [Clostridia bacterium]
MRKIIEGNIYDTTRRDFIFGAVVIEDGIISEMIRKSLTKESGKQYILPGFVDIHSHGAANVDMISASADDLVEMSATYARNGVTSLFPTTISSGHENILRMIDRVAQAAPRAKCHFEGIHLEGPYINPKKAGAHAIQSIRDPNLAELREIADATIGRGLKLHITTAPELPGADDFILEAVRLGATVSIGHTEACPVCVNRAIASGAISFTHLFNAMPPIHHRVPGTVTAALNSNVFAEIIADGIHLAPEIVNLVAKTKGVEKVIIVSDSMSAAGLGDGDFTFESLKVTVKDGKAVITGTDTIAGSAALLVNELNNFMRFTKIPLGEALLTVTANPADATGIKKGRLSEGEAADIITADIKGNAVSIREVHASLRS